MGEQAKHGDQKQFRMSTRPQGQIAAEFLLFLHCSHPPRTSSSPLIAPSVTPCNNQHLALARKDGGRESGHGEPRSPSLAHPVAHSPSWTATRTRAVPPLPHIFSSGTALCVLAAPSNVKPRPGSATVHVVNLAKIVEKQQQQGVDKRGSEEVQMKVWRWGWRG